jgi:hypothetical protein
MSQPQSLSVSLSLPLHLSCTCARAHTHTNTHTHTHTHPVGLMLWRVLTHWSSFICLGFLGNHCFLQPLVPLTHSINLARSLGINFHSATSEPLVVVQETSAFPHGSLWSPCGLHHLSRPWQPFLQYSSYAILSVVSQNSHLTSSARHALAWRPQIHVPTCQTLARTQQEVDCSVWKGIQTLVSSSSPQTSWLSNP